MTVEETRAVKSWDDFFENASIQKRLLFTLGALAIYRLGTKVPLPGLNLDLVSYLFKSGRIEEYSIFAQGIAPYISACAIMSLLQATHIIHYFEGLEKRGQDGRQTFMQLTRYLALCLTALQGFGFAAAISKMPTPNKMPAFSNPTAVCYVAFVLSLVAGTFFIIWLADQISEYGVGNGIPLILLTGIVSHTLKPVKSIYGWVANSQLDVFQALLVLAIVIGIFYAVIVIQKSPRKIPIQWKPSSKEGFVALRMDMAWLPARLFTSSVLAVPLVITSFMPNLPLAYDLHHFFVRGNLGYELVRGSLLVLFCFLFTSAMINFKELARKITKAGGTIANRHLDSKSVPEYLESIQERITLFGALFAAALLVLYDYSPRLFGTSMVIEGVAIFSIVAIISDGLRRLEAVGLSSSSGAVVFTTNNAVEADFVHDFLLAHEIKALALDTNICRIDPFVTIAVGGIQIYVPGSHVKRATNLLRDQLGYQGYGHLSPFDIRWKTNRLDH